MTRILVYALILLLNFQFAPALAQEAQDEVAPSLLRPDTTIKTEFRYPLDAIDPTPQTNPKGADAPGYRAQQQLVIYTPAFGSQTGTNIYGAEAVVVNGKIQSIANANSPIPPNGFVISGHGQAGIWMKRVLKQGATVELDAENRQMVIRITPAVYMVAVQEALQQAERYPQRNDAKYQEYLQDAQACYRKLTSLAQHGVTQQLVQTSDTCKSQADKAYYRSVASNANAFRGVWVRPVERSPEQIQKAIAELKEAKIKHLFVETYYLGQTLYPSGVMAEYGLPEQHAQFKGWDPLKAWIEAAHQNDMQVHAWVQVFFAGNRDSNLETYGPVLQKYPQWTNVQYNSLSAANPMPSTIEDGHYFVDPANPEVRQFLHKLISEMITRYDIDGVNLDYIRYPASHPSSNGQFLASTWGYTPTARQAFQAMITEEFNAAEAKKKEAEAKRIEELKKAGKPIPKVVEKPAQPPKADPATFTPSHPLWSRWVAWRKSQVSSFVKEVSEKVNATKPQLLVSAVVFPQTDPIFQLKLQDWPEWVANGWIEALTPIGLEPTPEGVYNDSMAFRRLTQDKVPVYPGMFGMYNRATPVEFLSQIDAVNRAGLPGVVLFERSRLDKAYREALMEGAFRN